MTSTDIVAVFDIGKTNLKLSFVAPDGAVIGSASTANKTIAGAPYPHFDVGYIWNWFSQTMAGSEFGANIRAINMATHGAAAALVDNEGLVLPVLDYECPVVEETSDAYEIVRDDFAETLSPLLPNGLNLGKQLFWLQKNFPEKFSQTRHILLYPQYWSWRLTGVPVSEITSLGCHTDLWLPGKGEYSSLAVNQGWDRLLPKIVPATQSPGTILPAIAAQLGLSRKTKIFAGLHDSNASLVPHLIARPNESFTVVSTGTWIISMAIGSTESHMREGRDMLANVNFLGETVPCMRFMGGREFAEISANVTPGKENLGDQIAALTTSGIFPLPSFTDQGGPFQDRAGRILGESNLRPESRQALAVIYCALMTDYCLDCLEASGDIIVEGSFVRTPAYVQCLAALRDNQPVYVSRDTTGTVSGAALMARIGSSSPPQLKQISKDRAQLHMPDYRDKWRRLLM